jgi:TetR/AcrR family transcriptional regulator, tetracycline repressor protein
VFPGEAPDAATGAATDAATGALPAAAVDPFLDATPARAPVSRDTIVAAAMDLLNEGGLELVSFRRIAARLQVSAPTLYWHVENKRQLMDLMAEEIVRRTRREPLEPGPGEPWWAWLRTHAQQMFDTLVETRDAPRVLAGNRPSPEAFPAIERTLRVLVDAGLTPGDAQQALFAIGAYVIGSATEWQAEAERATAHASPGPAGEGAAADRAAEMARRPGLVAALAELRDQPHRATFEYGLDVIIDGLRARHTGQPPVGQSRER